MKRLVVLLVVIIFMMTFVYSYTEAARSFVVTSTIKPSGLLIETKDRNGNSVENSYKQNYQLIKTDNDCTTIQGVIGTDDQRVYIENPPSGIDGWSLSLSKYEKMPASSLEIDCVRDSYDVSGGLSNTSITSDCKQCSFDGLAKGSMYELGSQNSTITLVQADVDAENHGRWYITDIGWQHTVATQAIKNHQYSMNVVLTLTAN